MQLKTDKIVVLGGGITGLTVAHELAMAGHRVELVEASSRLGGRATAFRWNGQWIDTLYHPHLPSDENLLELIHQAGLSDQVDWRQTSMGLFSGRLYGLNGFLDLLQFEPLSFPERVRFGLVSLFLGRWRGKQNLDGVRTEEWMVRQYGPEIWRRFVQPLIASRFGVLGGELPASYVLECLNRTGSTNIRGYLRGGYSVLVDALESRLRSYGASIRTEAMVESIDQTQSGLEIALSDGRMIRAAWGVCTLPLPVLRQTIAHTSLEERVSLPNVRYQGTINALLFLKRPVETHLWTAVSDPRAQFDAVAQVSQLSDPAQFGQHHAVSLVKSCDRFCTVFQESHRQIAERWSQQFLALYANEGLTPEDVLDVRVFKSPFVEPVYPLNYGAQVPAVNDGESHLFLATAAQMYPRPVSWDSSVWLARKVVRELRGRLRLEVSAYREEERLAAA